MIGRLLGHRDIDSTARYAHLARESVRTSTTRVAENIFSSISCDATPTRQDRHDVEDEEKEVA